DVRPHGRVFRIEMPSLAVRTLDDDIRFTNGIAFGPDDDLYANETLTGEVFRYHWLGGDVGPRQSFGNVLVSPDREQISGPDGMKFSADGRLFVTVFGQGDVTVLGPDGQVLERLLTDGAAPTNLVFGAAGSGVIYVTEDAHGTLERLDVGVDGLKLHQGDVATLTATIARS
ncbi:MAG: SMP-30/gluconolactonase/LRE family protein, partial [Chloroflexota bacterium]